VESLPAIEKEGMGSVEKRKETEYVKIVGDRYRADTILENNSRCPFHSTTGNYISVQYNCFPDLDEINSHILA